MKTVVFMFAVVLVGSGDSARAQNEQGLRDAFLSEAPQCWRNLPEIVNCYRTETQKVERRKETGSAELIQRYKYSNLRSNSGSQLGSVEEDGGHGAFTKSICINDRYAFLVTRNQSDKPWLLGRIDLHPSQGPDSEIGGYKLRGSKGIFYGWLTINNNMQLIDMVTNPTFKIISASEQTNSGQAGEVRIEFTVTNLVKKVIEEKYSGWMQFNRSRYWALTSYEITGASSRNPGGHGITKCSHKYIDHPNGLPISSKMVEVHKGYVSAEKLFVTVTTEMDTKFSEDCPKEAEFELSAYGIAEPIGVAPKRNTLIWWFIGGGIFVALLGYFVIKRVRKV